MAGSRVLITGRYGFTGHYVAQELEAAGWDVWGMGNASPPKADPCYVQANLNDAAALRAGIERIRPDAVLHLAAIAFVGHGAVEDFYRVNLIGTRNLLDAIAESGCGQKGVVLASSANVYGNVDAAPLHEDTPPAPENDYAVSKLAMEYMARLFNSRLPLVIARPFNYTGRGQDAKFLVPKIVSHFKTRAPGIELGNIDVARDFSDVRDVAHAYRSLLEVMPQGQTVNICSGKANRLQDILTFCRELTGHDIDVTINPAFVRDNEVKTLTGDITRLDSFVDQTARRSLKDTLRWMLN